MRRYRLDLGAVVRTDEYFKIWAIVALNYCPFSEGLPLSCQ